VKVFIGSSSEAKSQVDKVAGWLEALKVTVRRWDRDLALGEDLLGSLIRMSKDVDAGIFIFREDDEVRRSAAPHPDAASSSPDGELTFRTGALRQTRDNVLIEFGLFAGALGPARAVIATSGRPKIPADLRGILYVDIETNPEAEAILTRWVEGLRIVEDLTCKHVNLLRHMRAKGQACLDTEYIRVVTVYECGRKGRRRVDALPASSDWDGVTKQLCQHLVKLELAEYLNSGQIEITARGRQLLDDPTTRKHHAAGFDSRLLARFPQPLE
jgi:hypothetical protein